MADGGQQQRVELQAQWSRMLAERSLVTDRGAAAAKTRGRIEQARQAAQARGDEQAIARLDGSFARWNQSIEELRDDYRRLSARLHVLADDLRSVGIDPERINTRLAQRAASAGRRRQSGRDWNTEAATDKQRNYVARLLRDAGLETGPPDELTKQQADQAIKSLLSGTTPTLKPAAEQEPTATPSELDETRPAPEPDPQALMTSLVTAAAADEELAAAAGTDANNRDQYEPWAIRHARSRIVRDLSDHLDDPNTREQAQDFLGDDAALTLLGTQAAEQAWCTARPDQQQDRDTDRLADAIAEHHRSGAGKHPAHTITADDQEQAQQRAQDALDQAGAAELVDWHERGREEAAAEEPGQRPDLADDAVAHEAISAAGADSVAGRAVAGGWSAGVTETLSDLAPQQTAALLSQAGRSIGGLAHVGEGRGAAELAADPDFRRNILDYVRAQQPRTHAETHARAGLLHGGVSDAAFLHSARSTVTVWRQAHPLPMEGPDLEAWTAYARGALENDPLVASWAGEAAYSGQREALRHAAAAAADEWTARHGEAEAAWTRDDLVADARQRIAASIDPGADTGWTHPDFHRWIHEGTDTTVMFVETIHGRDPFWRVEAGRTQRVLYVGDNPQLARIVADHLSGAHPLSPDEHDRAQHWLTARDAALTSVVSTFESDLLARAAAAWIADTERAHQAAHIGNDAVLTDAATRAVQDRADSEAFAMLADAGTDVAEAAIHSDDMLRWVRTTGGQATAPDLFTPETGPRVQRSGPVTAVTVDTSSGERTVEHTGRGGWVTPDGQTHESVYAAVEHVETAGREGHDRPAPAEQDSEVSRDEPDPPPPPPAPAPEAEPEAGLPQVPQEQQGVPLSQWRGKDLITAERPDGSRVMVTPEMLPGAAPATDESAVDVTEQAEQKPPEREKLPQTPAPPAVNYRPTGEVEVPSGARARITANIAAIRLLDTLDGEARPASADEQQMLAAWSGWGGCKDLFDNAKPQFAEQRGELRELLTSDQYAAAQRSILNAHYTDPHIVSAVWDVLGEAGLPEGARVLEPGCGSGGFIGQAPGAVHMVGVEVDPMTARIATWLYPEHQVRGHGFERQFAADGSFAAAVGNVPFGRYPVYDPVHNPNGRHIHNAFIAKSLALTQPGGYVAAITSTYTSDTGQDSSRQEIADLGDVVSVVRLPAKTFQRQARTDVQTDLLVLRRREPDQERRPETDEWIGTDRLDIDGEQHQINSYLHARSDHLCGELTAGRGRFGPELQVRTDDLDELPDRIRAVIGTDVEEARSQGYGFTATVAGQQVDAGLDAPGFVSGDSLERAVLPGTLAFDSAASTWEQYTAAGQWERLKSSPGAKKTAEWHALLGIGDTVTALMDAGRGGSTREQRDQLRAQLDSQYSAYVEAYGPINRWRWTSHVTENTPDQAAAKFAQLEAKWRKDHPEMVYGQAGNIEYDEEGSPRTAPVSGPLPREVHSELADASWVPQQAPYKKSGHLEGAIKHDPRISLARGIEQYKDEDHTAARGPIFTEDVVATITPARSANSAGEAVAISFDERAEIDIDRMAELLDCTADETIRRGLSEKAMFPSLDRDGEWVPAAAFLSGNVREKLAQARELAQDDPGLYGLAADALHEVVPPDVDPSKITIRPGATWVPVDVYRQFFTDEFGLDGDDLAVEYEQTDARWAFSTWRLSQTIDREGYTDPYGVAEAGRSGVQIFQSLANNKALLAYKTEEEREAAPKPPFHPQRTAMLNSAGEQLQARFSEWLWQDEARADRLMRLFNEKMNARTQQVYDTTYKSWPGMTGGKSPYPYQAEAAVRALHEETILLDHCVGAGKTMTMSMIALEKKRLGQAAQPWIVVPNHLVGQWQKEVVDVYPSARMLVAGGTGTTPADRQRFIGQSVTGDYDVVIIPQSIFGKIGVKTETQIGYIREELAHLEERLDDARAGGRDYSAQRIEQAKATQENRLNTLLDASDRDTGLTFEDSGCDYLMVDEAHDYKNLARTADAEELALTPGAGRAADLDMKLRYLRGYVAARNAAAGRDPHHPSVGMFATGTPVSNNMAEMWITMRFLSPEMLAEGDMSNIDGFAKNFTRTRSTVEMNITGTRLQSRNRIAEYNNMPQLLGYYDSVRHVVTRDQIPRELPSIASGQRQVLSFEQSQEALDFNADLDHRLGAITYDTMAQDNALNIANDGRNASLYPPLAHLGRPEPEHDRIAITADRMWRIHEDTKDIVTPADAYGPEATGMLQLVFCDRGTPNGVDQVDLYSALRDELVDRGMNASRIAFIHDYPTAKKKAQLFADCNAGKVNVLIGSTQMMGTGMNVQRLAKSLFHMDVPWKPADIEQREGRVIRQGNVNHEVEIYNVVAERSFDTTMWQTVERKAHYIAQIRMSDVPAEMEDIGAEFAASAAATKAAATGDRVYIDAVEKKAEVDALRAERRGVERANLRNDHQLRSARQELPIARQRLREAEEMRQPLGEWVAAPRESRHISAGGQSVREDKVGDLIEATQKAIQDRVIGARIGRSNNAVPLFEIAGQQMDAQWNHTLGELSLTIGGHATRRFSEDYVYTAASANAKTTGMLTQVRNMVSEAAGSAERMQQQIEQTANAITRLEQSEGRMFERAGELRDAETELATLDADIAARENSPEAMLAEERSIEDRNARGLYQGWTLELNPTPAYADAKGMTQQAVRDAVPEKMSAHAQQWEDGRGAREKAAVEAPWQPLDETRYEYHYTPSADMKDRGEATTRWTGRQWAWTVTRAGGEVERGTRSELAAAQHIAQTRQAKSPEDLAGEQAEREEKQHGQDPGQNGSGPQQRRGQRRRFGDNRMSNNSMSRGHSNGDRGNGRPNQSDRGHGR